MDAQAPLRPSLLFCSYHCYSDPGGGAALATRDLLEWLTRRGWRCRVFCGAQLDIGDNSSLEQLLAVQRIAYRVKRRTSGPAVESVYQFVQGGVPVTVYHVPGAHPGQAPGQVEGTTFLALLETVLDRHRPDMLLTYGGHWLARAVIAAARRRGIPVIFALHNFDYPAAGLFRDLNAVFVPSQCCQEHYRHALGLEATVLPNLIDWSRVHCPEVQGRYVTFVNPAPQKGLFFFVRIAAELGRRRPDIPLLVQEGRARVGLLGQTGLDLGGLSNLFYQEPTTDPRDFYRVSRLVLMPSLWRESFGRVAVEACLNGIPVLASNRGSLPETLAEAGLRFDIPERYTPESRLVPSPEEVAPWVEAIVQLWDDREAYEQEWRRCLLAAEAWRPERVGVAHEAFFEKVIARAGKPLQPESGVQAAAAGPPGLAELLPEDSLADTAGIENTLTAEPRPPQIIRPYRSERGRGRFSFSFGPWG